MKKILIIEDDNRTRRFLQLELEHEGYSVSTAIDGHEGFEKFNNHFYHLVLLDLMLPKLSGEDICKKIREISDIPIIVLTAKGKTLNKVELLDMGADDYLTKPFEIEELLARMRVMFRNKNDFSNSNFIHYGNLKLDTQKKVLYKNLEKILLTRTEYNILYYLMVNKEIVKSREKILNEIWGYDYDGEDKIVDVYIKNLRKKIDTDNEKYIHTLWGFGYVVKKGDES